MRRFSAVFGLLLLVVGCNGAQGAAEFRAACQVVADDLATCLSARKRWIADPGSSAPSCLIDPIPAAHRDEFQRAAASAGSAVDPDTLRGLNGAMDAVVMSFRMHDRTEGVLDQLVEAIADNCMDLDS